MIYNLFDFIFSILYGPRFGGEAKRALKSCIIFIDLISYAFYTTPQTPYHPKGCSIGIFHISKPFLCMVSCVFVVVGGCPRQYDETLGVAIFTVARLDIRLVDST